MNTVFASQALNRELESESCTFKPNFDCFYTLAIDIAPNGFKFSVQNVTYNPNFDFI